MSITNSEKIEALIKAIDKMDNYIKYMDISLYGRICNARHFNDYKFTGGTKTEDELAQHKQELNMLKHKTIIEDSVTQFYSHYTQESMIFMMWHLIFILIIMI